MKRVLGGAAVVLAAAAVVLLALGAFGGGSSASGDPTYTIELNNAFGLVNGEQFKVAGVPAGSISAINLDQKTLNALVTVQVTTGGYGTFHEDATCESRPQSLIGEYFIDCNPGTQNSPVLKNGGLIPVSHTFSTIPADLLQNVMRMPYRERLTLIINELGAGVAGNPANLQSAIERAVPALTQTDNVLSQLAGDSRTLEGLTTTADSVITALANNGRNIQRFIVEADNTAVDSASQRTNLQATFQNLPGFLAQLRPALADLGAAADANVPVLSNLNASSGEVDRLVRDLVPFSRAAKPAVSSLGQASVTGRAAVNAAGPAVTHLNQFAKPAPELAQNLAIILHDLDLQSKAVEPDPRSPGGKGYSGLQALLQYVFDQTNAVDYFGQFGHILAVDAFVNQCSGYQSPGTVAENLKLLGPSSRQCYSWLGPNQPGVNERDPTNPTAPVPDPGGEPPGVYGTNTTPSGPTASAIVAKAKSKSKAKRAKRNARHRAPSRAAATPSTSAPAATALPAGGSGAGAGTGTTAAPPTNPGSAAGSIGQALGQLLGGLLGGSSSGGSSSGGSSQSTPSQAQQLLNYLLAP
ncbi:MAG TPA: MlaD family protein [Solirubrobacteraceae bacterium]